MTPSQRRALEMFQDQLQWFENHGGSLTGYLERYGSSDDPHHYGAGGEAIYAADKTALDDAYATYKRRCGK